MASALSQAKELANYNNKLEQANVKLQYDYNKKLADENRDWQEMMSNSAHQREIEDMRKAGLNPVLSVTGGSGASTPTGSSASVSKPDTDMSLPRAVMDMAVAQLNSATQLQTTAMNNANTLEAIYRQGEQERLTKAISSGDSYYGQYTNAKNDLYKKTSGLFSFLNDNGLTFRGVTLPKIPSPTGKSTDIDSLISDLKKGKVSSAKREEKRVTRKKTRQNKRQERRSNLSALKDVLSYFLN